MLEQLRQQSRSFIIWILFGIIILVFIISFGPQANAELGCGAEDVAVLEVDDKIVGDQAWRYAINGLPQMRPDLARGRKKQQRQNIAMDLLLARELLAQEGEKAGFRISDELINDKLQKGEWYFLGSPAGPDAYFVDGYFNFESLERFSQNLGLQSVEAFRDQQRRELLADAARNMLIAGVNVSAEEVLAAFQHENTVANVDYVRFRTADYKNIVLTDDQVASYLAANEAEVKEKYEAEEANYKGTKAQARIRLLLLGTTAETKDAVKNEADELRARLAAGDDFAAAATARSDDKLTARRGGLLGWKRIDRPGLPFKELSDALAGLEPGKVSEVIETPRGYYVLKVDDKREGDLSFDQVKTEIAEDLAVTHFARKAARADADAALAMVKEGATLADLFDKQAPQMDPVMMRRQLGLPPDATDDEVMRAIEQRIRMAPKSGSIVIHGPAIPAEWQGDGAAKPAAAKAEKPAAAKAKKPAKPKPAAGKSARGAPADAKAAGAGDDEAATPKFTSPDDGLPRPDKLTMPKLESAGPILRERENVAGLGQSPEAVKAIFDELEIGATAHRLFEFGDDFVLLKLTSRREPDLDDFKKRESVLLQQARFEKANDVLGSWLQKRCRDLHADDKIGVNNSYLTVQDDNGKNLPVTYKACQFF